MTTYTCLKCGSTDMRLEECRCGIPCILLCMACGKRDYDTVPHKWVADET